MKISDSVTNLLFIGCVVLFSIALGFDIVHGFKLFIDWIVSVL